MRQASANQSAALHFAPNAQVNRAEFRYDREGTRYA